MTTRAALAAALAVLAGCAKLDNVPADAVQDCDLTVTPGTAATDILFVIDDSTSMGGEQTLLKNGLYQFIQALAASPIATDLHIGVTTTAVVGWTDTQTSYTSGPSSAPISVPYAAGTIVAIARDGGGTPIPGAFVYSNGAYEGSRILSSGQASLRSDFEANVLVGTWGSTREQPFAAARRALEKSAASGPNAGFLRRGARLAIVFLSDEDDCSGPSDATITQSSDCRNAKLSGTKLTPVGDVAAFLQGPIDGETRDVVVAAIVGVAPGTLALSCGQTYCSNRSCGTATDDGARFVELLGHFPADHTSLASICDADFANALAGLADVIMPDTLPLDGAPADWRMLVASLQRPGVGTVPCNVALAGSVEAATAGAVYRAPQSGSPATLTFQNTCAIERGDTVDVKVICAG
jgi:hypothetical protein